MLSVRGCPNVRGADWRQRRSNGADADENHGAWIAAGTLEEVRLSLQPGDERHVARALRRMPGLRRVSLEPSRDGGENVNGEPFIDRVDVPGAAIGDERA